MLKLSKFNYLLIISVFILVTNLTNVANAQSQPLLQTSHYACFLGNAVFTRPNWTPIILLNLPYGGSANAAQQTTVYGSFTIAGLSFSSQSSFTNNIQAQNGQAAGLFSLDNWTWYQATTKLVPGEGKDKPCPGPYVPEDTYHSNNIITYDLLKQGNTSDENEPTSFWYQDPFTHISYPSITFQNGYSVNNYGYRSTCSGPSTQVTLSQTILNQVSFSVSASYNGVQYSVSGLLEFVIGSSNTQSYTYYFPGYYGTWLLDSLYASNQAGALAFKYIHC